MCCATAEETPKQETEEKPAQNFRAEGEEKTGTLLRAGNSSFVTSVKTIIQYRHMEKVDVNKQLLRFPLHCDSGNP